MNFILANYCYLNLEINFNQFFHLIKMLILRMLESLSSQNFCYIIYFLMYLHLIFPKMIFSVNQRAVNFFRCLFLSFIFSIICKLNLLADWNHIFQKSLLSACCYYPLNYKFLFFNSIEFNLDLNQI